MAMVNMVAVNMVVVVAVADIGHLLRVRHSSFRSLELSRAPTHGSPLTL